MSGGQSGYELSEAKAILTELKSIRKAISSGEKEKQDLMQVGSSCPHFVGARDSLGGVQSVSWTLDPGRVWKGTEAVWGPAG